MNSQSHVPYSFALDTEPTDAQLEQLMAAVLIDVQERAMVATKKFEVVKNQKIQEALSYWQLKYPPDASK
jgi:stress response protein SCP2